MSILNEEQLNWNDECFSELLGENNGSPVNATIKIIQRIKSDPYYIIILLRYSKLRINYPFSGPSLIAISKIIQIQPEFFLQNYDEFKPLFYSLIESVKDIPELNQQRFIGHIINCSVEVLVDYYKDMQELEENLDYFEKLFYSCQENLDTNPICLFMLPSVNHFRNFRGEKILLVLYNIIVKYYQQTHDFGLLIDTLRFFCRFSSLKSDFDENYEKIFDTIYELAVKSFELESNQFECFWSAIQDININRSGPFFQLAIQFLEVIQNHDIKMVLFSFIEEHAALISPDQVPDLLNIFFDSIFNQSDFNLSDYSFLESLSVVDSEIFYYVYEFLIEAVNQDFPNSKYVFINSILCMLDKYKLEIDPLLQDIINKCNSLLSDSIQNQDFDIAQNILTLFMNIVRVFPDDENIKLIPNMLIELFELELDIEFYKTLLYTIACSIPSIEKQPIFDQILRIFLENYESITPKTASFFFFALFNYLPDGRLFPESQYDKIQELIKYYLEFFETEKTGRFTLSIFIFKLYLQDQATYSHLLPNVIETLCIAYSADIDEEIIYNCCKTLLTYIKYFGKKAFPLLNGDEYYTNLLETLIDDKQNNKNFSYISIISQICIYDRDEFSKRAEYSRYLVLSFYKDNSPNMELVINCLSKLLYRLPNTPLITNILHRIENTIPISINKIDTEQLLYLVQLASSLIQPASIEYRKGYPDDDFQNIATQAVQMLEKTACDLINYSTENINNFRLFFDSISEIIKSLCPHNSEVIHTFFVMMFGYFDIENEEIDVSDKIYEMREFLNITYEMAKNDILQDDEGLMIKKILEKLLCDLKYSDLFTEIYIILSCIILTNSEYVIPFIEILKEHWSTLENEYMISILGTLFMMIFVLLPDKFNPEEDFELVERISNQFQPSKENCNYYLKSSIEFLSNYPDIPIDIKKNFFHSFIIYLSYQEYCYNIFKVKEEVHERLLEVVKQLMSELPNCEEIIKSCFPDSPRALQGTLKMLGITSE